MISDPKYSQMRQTNLPELEESKLTHSLIGGGLGAAAALAINKFLLKNTSTKSKILSALIGAGVGGAGGFAVNRLATKKEKNRLIEENKKLDDYILNKLPNDEAEVALSGDLKKYDDFVKKRNNLILYRTFGDPEALDYYRNNTINTVIDDAIAEKNKKDFGNIALGSIGKESLDSYEWQLSAEALGRVNKPSGYVPTDKWLSSQSSSSRKNFNEGLERYLQTYPELRKDMKVAKDTYRAVLQYQHNLSQFVSGGEARLPKGQIDRDTLKFIREGFNSDKHNPLYYDTAAVNAMPKELADKLPVLQRIIAVRRMAATGGISAIADGMVYDITNAKGSVWGKSTVLKQLRNVQIAEGATRAAVPFVSPMASMLTSIAGSGRNGGFAGRLNDLVAKFRNHPINILGEDSKVINAGIDALNTPATMLRLFDTDSYLVYPNLDRRFAKNRYYADAMDALGAALYGGKTTVKALRNPANKSSKLKKILGSGTSTALDIGLPTTLLIRDYRETFGDNKQSADAALKKSIDLLKAGKHLSTLPNSVSIHGWNNFLKDRGLPELSPAAVVTSPEFAAAQLLLTRAKYYEALRRVGRSSMTRAKSLSTLRDELRLTNRTGYIPYNGGELDIIKKLIEAHYDRKQL